MRLTLVLLLSLTFFSCQPNYLLNEEKIIDNSTWRYKDKLNFEVKITDLTKVYDLNLIITHTTDYSYENVYMKVYTKFPTIDVKEEQLTIQMSDKTGKWVGKCNSTSCILKVFMLENFKFPEVGKYNFEFEQFTREENLQGLESFQLQIIPNEK